MAKQRHGNEAGDRPSAVSQVQPPPLGPPTDDANFAPYVHECDALLKHEKRRHQATPFLLLPFVSLHYTSPPEIKSISVPGAMTKAHAKKREACPIGRKCPRVLRHYHVAADDDDGVACKKGSSTSYFCAPGKGFHLF